MAYAWHLCVCTEASWYTSYICMHTGKWHMLNTYVYIQRQADILKHILISSSLMTLSGFWAQWMLFPLVPRLWVEIKLCLSVCLLPFLSPPSPMCSLSFPFSLSLAYYVSWVYLEFNKQPRLAWISFRPPSFVSHSLALEVCTTLLSSCLSPWPTWLFVSTLFPHSMTASAGHQTAFLHTSLAGGQPEVLSGLLTLWGLIQSVGYGVRQTRSSRCVNLGELVTPSQPVSSSLE